MKIEPIKCASGLEMCTTYTMIIRPPFQVFVVIGIVYSVIKFLIDLWQAVGDKREDG
jgi:hypothetical protein